MHHSDEIDQDSGENCKPEIINYYNSTKGGVDTVDFMKGNYSTSRNSHRWPMTIFFSLLNIGGINSQIIYTNNTRHILPRKKYLADLAKVLVLQEMKKIVQTQSIPISMKNRIHEITGTKQEQFEKQGVPGRCGYCDWRKNRKTKTVCGICETYICKEHSGQTVCVNCQNSNEENSE